MTERLHELADLPEGLALEGKLVALGDDGLSELPAAARASLDDHGEIGGHVRVGLLRESRPCGCAGQASESLD